jgi:AbrB family looped-hinge helix DNA binding protein
MILMPYPELQMNLRLKEGSFLMPRVKVRKFNQVTIPKKIGAEIGVGEGDYVEVEKTPEGNILLKPLKAILIDKKQMTQEKVLALVREGEITTSQAAELLGMQYQDFLELMHKKGIPLLNLTKDLREKTRMNAERLFSKEKT